jgi:hypothetical protein
MKNLYNSQSAFGSLISFKLCICFILILILSIGVVSGQTSSNSSMEARNQTANNASVVGGVHSQLPIPVICTKATPQPIDPVEMNSGIDPYQPNLVRTVHVEKETFACQKLGAPVGDIKYMDVTLVTQISGIDNGREFIFQNWLVNATVCERDLSGEMLTCGSPSIPIIGYNERPVLKQCTEQSPILPLEMNTLFSDDPNSRIPIKSVIAEKHSYTCIVGNSTVPNKIKETILFTFQGQLGQAFTTKFAHVNFQCIKDLSSTTIESCSITFEALPAS